MPALWIVEAIDVFEQCYFRLPPGPPQAAPNQLSLKGFEESFNDGVVPRVKPEDRLHNFLSHSLIFQSRIF
jgi:hypothetical protein